jgi:monoamine oxidase
MTLASDHTAASVADLSVRTAPESLAPETVVPDTLPAAPVTADTGKAPVTIFGPDFPFAYDDWLNHPAGLGTIPEQALGTEVAVIGGGVSGMVAAFELMRLGLKPVIFEASRLGGRLRTEHIDPGAGLGRVPAAELGGMRFPISSTTLFHYIRALGLETRAFPNPLTPAAGSTVVDLAGQTWYAETLEDLPEFFHEVAAAWDAALEEELGFTGLQDAIRERDTARLKAAWNEIVRAWDDRSFYEFVASSRAFSTLSFRHREVFGQVGFGTGGWDSDFANTMLEILRVVVTNCDSDQELIVGGADQVPVGLWERPAGAGSAYWPESTSLASLHEGAPHGAVKGLTRLPDGTIEVRYIERPAEASAGAGAQDATGAPGTSGGQDTSVPQPTASRAFPAVLATCQSWLLTTQIDCDESLFSQDMWMALDRTRYMQSSKTFVAVDRPFWLDTDPVTGRHPLSMTLTDRLTRGTYLFDDGPENPGLICLSYSWMSDALKMLPHTTAERVDLALDALGRIYPDLDIRSHIVGEPVTVSWESDPYFLGAFKGALPGHYRYNERMFSHFKQDATPDEFRGMFLAGDDVAFTPAWAEGAVQTALNAVWGIMTHFGGHTHPENPGPGDVYDELGPIRLED